MARTVNVDKNGVDAEGNEYGWVASKDMVDAGLAQNHAVRLRYPDGTTTTTNEVRITQKGVAALGNAMKGER